jgi:hypothetical protein
MIGPFKTIGLVSMSLSSITLFHPLPPPNISMLRPRSLSDPGIPSHKQYSTTQQPTGPPGDPVNLVQDSAPLTHTGQQSNQPRPSRPRVPCLVCGAIFARVTRLHDHFFSCHDDWPLPDELSGIRALYCLYSQHGQTCYLRRFYCQSTRNRHHRLEHRAAMPSRRVAQTPEDRRELARQRAVRYRRRNAERLSIQRFRLRHRQ